MRVAVLGLGNLGSALAGALLDAGHSVTVWNRTPGKSKSLAARGASVARSGEEAVASAPVTVVCVTRYEHVREALAGLEQDDLAGRTLVNLTWGTPEDAERMQDWVRGLGGAYLDGGVSVTPSEIGARGTEIIYSGSKDAWETHRDVLAAFGGASQWVGEGAGDANVVSLAIPGTYYQVALGAFIEAVAYAVSRGVEPAALRSITRSSTKMLELAVDDTLDRITAGAHATDQATLEVILDSLIIVRDAMDTAGQRGTLARAMIDVLERGVAAGRGDEGYSALFPVLRDGE